jgi:hypothetical protein
MTKFKKLATAVRTALVRMVRLKVRTWLGSKLSWLTVVLFLLFYFFAACPAFAISHFVDEKGINHITNIPVKKNKVPGQTKPSLESTRPNSGQQAPQPISQPAAASIPPTGMASMEPAPQGTLPELPPNPPLTRLRPEPKFQPKKDPEQPGR